MQKLITIYLDDDEDINLEEREHLNPYLSEGWKVANITPLGGAYGMSPDAGIEKVGALGWFAVVIER